ncbi:MAG: hypothetical protein O3A96_12170 [Proteobacteria bacterium]|nr:hypothetical protein [Pseudomonadota bacterium]
MTDIEGRDIIDNAYDDNALGDDVLDRGAESMRACSCGSGPSAV